MDRILTDVLLYAPLAPGPRAEVAAELLIHTLVFPAVCAPPAVVLVCPIAAFLELRPCVCVCVRVGGRARLWVGWIRMWEGGWCGRAHVCLYAQNAANDM